MSLEFESSPSLATLYPRVLLARKPAWVRDGATVPPISAVLRRLRVDRSHLRAYRELCGYDADGQLPLPYPHVLAAALHLAVLASDAFPVRLLGLVHIRNRIRLHAALPDDVAGSLHVAIAGHVDTDRGQEFTLQTRLLDPHDECLWEEDSVFLARRRSGAARSGSGARSETVSAGVRTTSFRAPSGLGRSYGWLAGDLNPIHLSDITARLFGFNGAIAHGMWSLARSVADLDRDFLRPPCLLDVAFKLPLGLPSWVLLEQWQTGATLEFCLRDQHGEKPHLTGRLTPAA